MVDELDDDRLLSNDDDSDDQLITSDDRQPNIEAVFVVTFDVKYGNIIEFQMPEKEFMSLSGVEYKAIPSGSHHINEDFVYFRHENKYGLACIARTSVTNEDDGSALSVLDQSQRGMRIKSVGIITSSIIHIQSYLNFLQNEAKNYLSQSSINYDRLKGLLIQYDQPLSIPRSIYDILFAEFLQRFGPSIFPLTRLILLDKRILLYSSSPIGSLCNAVYFSHILNQSVNPLFFVTITDLVMLENEESYIACTTEKIFKEKHNLYDVFIDCDKQIVFHTNNSTLQSIVKITRYDRARLEKPMTLNSFINTGNRLSRGLDQISKYPDQHQQMTTEDFNTIDLHPDYDRLFLNEYIRLNHIPHVTITNRKSTISFPFSPCCSCLNPN